MATTQLPATVTTMVQSTKPPPVAQVHLDQQTTTTAHNANDSDSLSNLTLSQQMWFTTTTTQLNVLAMQQNKLETQMSNQLSTIMTQLENIQTSMEEQCTWLAEGFVPSELDPCLYHGHGMAVPTYVDDCIFFGQDSKKIDAVIARLKKKFDLTVEDTKNDVIDVFAYLGVEVKSRQDDFSTDWTN